MKTKKILKIICVVVAVLFCLTIVGGVVYGTISDYRKQSNDSCAVVECTDNTTPLIGTLSNYNELGTVKSMVVPYAGELTTTETVINIFSVYAPAEAFPITFYGYNGTSKKSTVINKGGELTVTTTFLEDSDTPDYRRILSSGTITYMLAVDCNGYIMYVDLEASEGYITFPFTATQTNGSYIDLYLTYSINDTGDYYNYAYDEGYDNGYTEAETAHEEDFTDGQKKGYAEGYDVGYTEGYDYGYSEGSNDGDTASYDEGYSDGYTAGNNVGYSSGYSKGYDVGYEEGYSTCSNENDGAYDDGYKTGLSDGYKSGYNVGYADGENNSVSVQLANPLSTFFEPVHEFMNTKFFGDLTYASIFNVVMFVTVAIIFLKMFGGG